MAESAALARSAGFPGSSLVPVAAGSARIRFNRIERCASSSPGRPEVQPCSCVGSGKRGVATRVARTCAFRAPEALRAIVAQCGCWAIMHRFNA